MALVIGSTNVFDYFPRLEGEAVEPESIELVLAFGTDTVEPADSFVWDATLEGPDGIEGGSRLTIGEAELDGAAPGQWEAQVEWVYDGQTYSDIEYVSVDRFDASSVTYLATAGDLTAYGYSTGATMLGRASTRVLGYLKGRTTAATLIAGTASPPAALVEAVCAIAYRMAQTSEQVSKGVQTENLSGGGVTWGAEAYAGTSDLTSAEKRVLDRLYARTPMTIYTDPQ